ncbi:glycosyltransferase [Halomonas sabkhae]|uniref:glycosyltransferase n=1 Tax=Halomonas sabkhae TaxID=626223 RepID=UPI0025B36A1D|nr:glycosyltransferase [Halomonas sabkhae]MDN3524160.1 glycosyltransferase [Halomonas sabkhae]
MSEMLTSPLQDLQREYRGWRVAIVHDWLVTQGGAEKVLDALLQAFPQAEVYTLVDAMPDEQRGRLKEHAVHTSLVQSLPFACRHYRYYLPVMPYAIEQFDLRDFDLVISSSHAVAKGVPTHPGQFHLCYCHTPVRYAWDMKEAYLRDAGFPAPLEWLVRGVLKRLRQWDHFASSQVDHFVANSRNVAARIHKYYGRQADVIHPPVDLQAFPFAEDREGDYYLAASRLVAYKRLDLIIEAFSAAPERRLKVVGDGPERKRLERLAAGHDNIELLGYQPAGELRVLMSQARAFVFAADEDFGILPLEAQACGTPVVAFGHGGALETVRPYGEAAPTGMFFETQQADSLNATLNTFETLHFLPQDCRDQAQRFGAEVFYRRLFECLQARMTRGIGCNE